MTDLTNLRIFVCTSPINMSLSFDRLMGAAQETFDQDPLTVVRVAPPTCPSWVVS